MNYGAIGYVIGHEITHGFDDQGRQFDSDGNLVDWWQENTKKAYLEKARCIIEQYGNYTEVLTGLKVRYFHRTLPKQTFPIFDFRSLMESIHKEKTLPITEVSRSPI